MRILIAVLTLSILFSGIVSSQAFAAKPKVNKSLSIPTTVVARYIKPKNSVFLLIAAPVGVTKVNYTLMYKASGVGQGVQGSFVPGKKGSFTKDIFLGTCSGKICVKHKDIKDIQVEVVTKYKNGKTATKVYKVK